MVCINNRNLTMMIVVGAAYTICHGLQFLNCYCIYCSAVLRSIFKMVVSLFVPLIIFFFVLDKGRTRYDQLFQSAVVDVSTLHRPVPIVGDRVQHIQL